MWPDPQETSDLVTFTEEILNGKLHFLCSEDSPNTPAKIFTSVSLLPLVANST